MKLIHSSVKFFVLILVICFCIDHNALCSEIKEENTTKVQDSTELQGEEHKSTTKLQDTEPKSTNTLKIEIQKTSSDENSENLSQKDDSTPTEPENSTSNNSNESLQINILGDKQSNENPSEKQSNQNPKGREIEQKLFYSKILRDNALSAIGRLMYTKSTVISNTQLNALRKLQKLLINRHYSATNLLPILKTNKNLKTKEQLVELFKLLAHTLSNDEKYRQIVEICLNALNDNKWDELLNKLNVNLLKNLTDDTEKYASPITDSIDTFDTIATKITSLLTKHEILSTSDLLDGLLTLIPLENNTPDLAYAENIVYNFLSQFHESVELTSNKIPNAYEMLNHTLSGLVKLNELNERVRNSILTVLPVIKNLSNPHLDTEIDPKIVDMRKFILDNDEINIEKLVLHVIDEENYPVDIIKGRDILISTFNSGLLTNSFFKNVDVYQSPSAEHLLLTLLNQLQDSDLLPNNLSNLIKSLYIHAKMQILNINEKPMQIRSDADVSELLFAYENLIYENNHFDELIKAIKDLRYNLLNRKTDWINLLSHFDYNQYTSARQCVHDFLQILSTIFSFDMSSYADTVKGLINKYMHLVNMHGEPLINPKKIMSNMSMRRELFGSPFYDRLMVDEASKLEERVQAPSTLNPILTSGLETDTDFKPSFNPYLGINNYPLLELNQTPEMYFSPLEYTTNQMPSTTTTVPPNNIMYPQGFTPYFKPTIYPPQEFKSKFNPTIFPPISNYLTTKPLASDNIILPYTNFNQQGNDLMYTPVQTDAMKSLKNDLIQPFNNFNSSTDLKTELILPFTNFDQLKYNDFVKSKLYKLNSEQPFDPPPKLNIPQYNQYAIEYKPFIKSLGIYSYLPSPPKTHNHNDYPPIFTPKSPEIQKIPPKSFNQYNLYPEFKPQFPLTDAFSENNFQPEFKPKFSLPSLLNQNKFQPEFKLPKPSLSNYNLQPQFPNYQSNFKPLPPTKYDFLIFQPNLNQPSPSLEIQNVKGFLDRNANQFPVHQNSPDSFKSIPNNPIPPRFLAKYNNIPITQ